MRRMLLASSVRTVSDVLTSRSFDASVKRRTASESIPGERNIRGPESGPRDPIEGESDNSRIGFRTILGGARKKQTSCPTKNQELEREMQMQKVFAPFAPNTP